MMTSVHGYFNMITETDMERYRAETFLTKEPETIAWIDDMKPGEVLYDVGANVGVYTLYAASRGIKVYAFEPVLKNYERLNENIQANGFGDVYPVHMGVIAKSCPVGLFVPGGVVGLSGGQCNGDGYKVMGISLDKFSEIYGYPDHVKIDIDGLENEVLRGAGYVINSAQIKSILVEVTMLNAIEIINIAQHFYGKGPSVWTTDNKYNTMTPHSRERRQREGIAAENVVFARR